MFQQLTGLDLERLRYAMGGALGATVYGVYSLVQLFKAGQAPSLDDLGRAGVNLLAALVCGVIAAGALGPALVALIPFQGLREAVDPWSVGMVVGGLFWELLPLLIEGARRIAGRFGGPRA